MGEDAPHLEVPMPPGHGGTRSKLESDPAMAAFVVERLGKMTLQQIAEACRGEFGPGRAPSRSAIHVYWHKLARRQREAAARPR